MIGDSISDMEAGRRAGCKTVILSDASVVGVRAEVTASTLLQAIPQLLAGLKVPPGE